MKFYPEGYLINTEENKIMTSSPNKLSEAHRDKMILESKAIICDSKHNIIVDLNGIKGIIPREEGAIGIKEGVIRDIAIISRVNKAVCFIIKDFIRDENDKLVAILSRRDAQIQCKNNFVNNLKLGDIVNAKITHMENFGVFADIGCGIISLLPIDSISVSRIEHPSERFTIGMNIRAIIKSTENNRITLSQKELLGTWEENANNFTAGETVAGIVRSIESYGIFVELAPNLAGLAELKDNVEIGQQASVYIKCIIPSKMKIKLIIIETFDYIYNPYEPTYFYNKEHIDSFLYSPVDCDKKIITEFS